MSKFLPIGERLKEERDRLGLSQTDFAALGGAGRKTQFNYETGERAPDGAYLAAIAAAGADVLYILTGQRSHQITESAAAYQPPKSAVACQPPISALSPDEAVLLDNYRNSPPDGQAAIKATSAALAQSKGVKKRAS